MKKIFLSFVLLLWILIAFVTIYKKLPSMIKQSLFLNNFSESDKFFLIDRNFYKVILICKDIVPQDSSILFESYDKNITLYSRAWYNKEYFIQKAPYYLYPRRVTMDSKGHKVRYKLIFEPNINKFRLYNLEEVVYADF